jgi:catechol 2,3-dioxygenase-like lactoylglutathione lyase family enzyme
MFDHVGIRAADQAASERFYATVLPSLEIEQTTSGSLAGWSDFLVVPAGGPRSPTRRLPLGFVAPSREHVDAFWRAGTAAGYRDDGAPGPRPQYSADYYGAFLLDPDGNSAEAVHRGGSRRGGIVDHLWIRVADVAAAGRFYATVAPHGGFRLRHETPELVRFASDDGGSLTLVAGAPSEDVHVAFPAHEDAAVDAFHQATTAAGYRDNGGPGERPAYHPGYYAAFVLDPDGNNIEVVNHNRG